MPQKKNKKRKQSVSIAYVIAGLLLIGIAGIFSLQIFNRDTQEGTSVAVGNMSHSEFISALEPHAKELQSQYGILPSIILGQAILESNWGQSTLASQYYNLFGIKASGDTNSVALDTQEYVNDEWITIKGKFRVYADWEASMDDHTLLFVNGTSWNQEQYHAVLQAGDYQTAANALQSAGYATDPDYAQKIINVIQSYNLNQYD